MVAIKDIQVVESPKILAVGESRVYTINFSDTGTPAAAGSTKAYDADGTDVTGSVLSGSNSGPSSDIITLPLFTPASEQTYRLVCTVSIGGQDVVGVVDIVCTAQTHATVSIGSNSYGDPDNVAALTPRFAGRGGTFTDATTPTRNRVVTWIDQVSAMVNIMLKTEGFTIPFTNADAVSLIQFFVEQEVVTIVNGSRGTGRFAPTTKRPIGSIQKLVMSDVQEFHSSECARPGRAWRGKIEPCHRWFGLPRV